MPTPPRSYSPSAADNLRIALLALAVAATSGCTTSDLGDQKPDTSAPLDIENIQVGGAIAINPMPDTTPPPALVPLAPKDGFSIYVVMAGDGGLLSIAKSHGIDLAALLAANPQIDDPDYIRIGQQIYMPAKEAPTQELCLPGALIPPPGMKAEDP